MLTAGPFSGDLGLSSVAAVSPSWDAKWSNHHRCSCFVSRATDPSSKITFWKPARLRTPNSFTVEYRPLESPLTAAVSARSAGQRPVSQTVPQYRSFAPGLSNAGRNLRDTMAHPPKVSTIPEEPFRPHIGTAGKLASSIVSRRWSTATHDCPPKRQLALVGHELTADRNAHDIPLASAEPCRTSSCVCHLTLFAQNKFRKHWSVVFLIYDG